MQALAERLLNGLAPRLTLVLVKRFRIALHTAQDLVHDVIIEIVEGRVIREQPIDDLEAYVSTVVIHRAIDEYRRVQRLHGALRLSESHVEPANVEERLLTDERAEAVRRAVYDLPQPYHSIFTRLLEGDASLAEVARALNISPKGIYTQYQRGLELLRKKIDGS
ncbi:MAG TPA: sigma-70 family RNA polymerase sigma factor [Thermoanaerobaculia bacterium]|nr:sigma-70 family RNA polymerase sigma factor [Thermoanaerobaculia bacterium]